VEVDFLSSAASFTWLWRGCVLVRERLIGALETAPQRIEGGDWTVYMTLSSDKLSRWSVAELD
jgi:hypothetical protein